MGVYKKIILDSMSIFNKNKNKKKIMTAEDLYNISASLISNRLSTLSGKTAKEIEYDMRQIRKLIEEKKRLEASKY